jgi:hypothetical protein
VRLWLDSKRAAQRYQITGQPTTNVPVRREQRQRFSLRDDQILELARYAVVIEEHYSAMAGEERPMDIEWALDGADGNLYVVQVGGRLGRRAGRKRRASEAGCRGSRWSKGTPPPLGVVVERGCTPPARGATTGASHQLSV